MLLPKLENVDCVTSGEKEIKVNSKGSEHSWTFQLETKNMILRNVALLNDASRHQFSLVYVKHYGHLKTANEPTPDDLTEQNNEIKRTYNLESTPTLQQVRETKMIFLITTWAIILQIMYDFLCFCV